MENEYLMRELKYIYIHSTDEKIEPSVGYTIHQKLHN